MQRLQTLWRGLVPLLEDQIPLGRDRYPSAGTATPWQGPLRISAYYAICLNGGLLEDCNLNMKIHKTYLD